MGVINATLVVVAAKEKSALRTGIFFLKESCGHINVNCVFARDLMRGIDIVKKNRYKTARKMLDDFAKIKIF